MTNTPKQLAQAGITASSAIIYTVPNSAGNYALIDSILLVNTTTTRKLVTIYLVPTGGSIATTNAIAYNFVLDIPGLPYVLTVKQILEQNGTLQVIADAVGVTVTASGVEVT